MSSLATRGLVAVFCTLGLICCDTIRSMAQTGDDPSAHTAPADPSQSPAPSVPVRFVEATRYGIKILDHDSQGKVEGHFCGLVREDRVLDRMMGADTYVTARPDGASSTIWLLNDKGAYLFEERRAGEGDVYYQASDAKGARAFLMQKTAKGKKVVKTSLRYPDTQLLMLAADLTSFCDKELLDSNEHEGVLRQMNGGFATRPQHKQNEENRFVEAVLKDLGIKP